MKQFTPCRILALKRLDGFALFPVPLRLLRADPDNHSPCLTGFAKVWLAYERSRGRENPSPTNSLWTKTSRPGCSAAAESHAAFSVLQDGGLHYRIYTFRT